MALATEYQTMKYVDNITISVSVVDPENQFGRGGGGAKQYVSKGLQHTLIMTNVTLKRFVI